MKQYHFKDIFKENPNGSLTLRKAISVNGVSFDPETSFDADTALGGVDFHQYKYLNIAAEEKNGELTIKGFYKPQ